MTPHPQLADAGIVTISTLYTGAIFKPDQGIHLLYQGVTVRIVLR